MKTITQLGGILAACAALFLGGNAWAITIVSSFQANTDLDAIAVDPSTGDVYLWDRFSTIIDVYNADGVFLRSIPRPGENTQSFGGLDFNENGLTFTSSNIVPGVGQQPMAFTIDPMTGAVLSSLAIPGGQSTTGGTFNPFTETFFSVDSGAPDTVFEFDVDTGAVLNSFDLNDGTTSDPMVFNITAGEIGSNPVDGNLLFVSAFEGFVIQERTSEGLFLQNIDLSSVLTTDNCSDLGFNGIAAISVIGTTGQVALGCTQGEILILSGLPIASISPPTEVPLPAAAFLFAPVVGVYAASQRRRKKQG